MVEHALTYRDYTVGRGTKPASAVLTTVHIDGTPTLSLHVRKCASLHRTKS